jgi:hypothetical protein
MHLVHHEVSYTTVVLHAWLSLIHPDRVPAITHAAVACAASGGYLRVLSTAFNADLGLCAAAYEGAMRKCAATEGANQLASCAIVAVHAPMEDWPALRSSLVQYLQQQSAKPAASAGAGQAAALLPGISEDADSFVQLLALLLTCCKCSMRALTEASSSSAEQLQAVKAMDSICRACGTVVVTLGAWSSTAQADSSSSSSGGGGCGGPATITNSSSTAAGSCSSSSSSTVVIAADDATAQGTSLQTGEAVPPAAAAAMLPPWLAVFARCLLALAQALKVAAGTAVESDFSQQDVWGGLLETVVMCRHAVLAVGGQLHHAGIAAGPLQQLQQQQEALLALLGQIPTEQPDNAEALLAVLRSLQVGGALQAVVSFAGGVCGQLPLRWGCNHPGCTNLAQRSEVLLVAGKSCVCGACRAAR